VVVLGREKDRERHEREKFRNLGGISKGKESKFTLHFEITCSLDK
jgi:hypothetical protein